MHRFRLPLIVFALLFVDSPFAGAAQRPATAAEQPAPTRPAAPQVVLNDQDSRETRADFEALLKRYPPSVGRVMRIDPSLMRNDAYLAPYPPIATFLQQHPDVVQNPTYYLEHVDYEMWNPRQPDDARSASVRAFQEMMQVLAVMAAVGGAAFVVIWIISTLVNYRRWYRTSKVQTEVHTKLLERFSSNEDLMAYMQTPAGRRFLESAPLPLDGPARSVGAPLSRILWSLQAGVVLAVASLGVLFVSNRVVEEIAQPLFAIGVLVLAIGTGFVVSAGASFVLSKRLGLLDGPAAERTHTGMTGA
jgi:hypothetical protein